tara:strand:- start:3596 stop:3823 length:228 start_codon:yes stop_codon:yes gene_type:complete
MKLDEKELTVLQGLQSEFNNTKMTLASIELQKYDTLKKLDVLKEHFAKHEEELVKKYGADAVINLQTGEVSEKKD